MNLWKILSVALGGAMGASIRYMVTLWSLERLGSGYPYGTLMVNLVGCLMIGTLSVIVGALPGHEWLKALLVTGFLGALTTFSTFAHETWADLEAGRLLVPALNVVISVILGFALVALGLRLGRGLLMLTGGGPVSE